MNKTAIGIFLALASNYCLAFDNNDAINLVKQFSKTVACSVNDESFKAVKAYGDLGTSEDDDSYVVYWEGDFGCSGGNGSINPVFSIVKLASFQTPVVIPTIQQPNLDMVCADSISKHNDSIKINGITYSDSDAQHSPSKPVQFILKLGDDDKLKVTQKNWTPKESISSECVQRVR